jgi:hypothetical protein
VRHASSEIAYSSSPTALRASEISVLVGDRTKLVPRFAQLSKERFDPLTPPVNSSLDLYRKYRDPLDVRRREFRERVDVSPVEGVRQLLNSLHVLLRHWVLLPSFGEHS